jgi:hypothetical protein
MAFAAGFFSPIIVRANQYASSPGGGANHAWSAGWGTKYLIEFTTPGAHDMGVINWGYMIRTYKNNGLEFRPSLSLGEYDKNNTKP